MTCSPAWRSPRRRDTSTISTTRSRTAWPTSAPPVPRRRSSSPPTLGATLGDALAAYAEAFEAMAACAAASHPALYEGGWHPTAVCGPIGAAVAACRLLGLSLDEREQALRLALLRTGRNAGCVRFGRQGDSGRPRRRPRRSGGPARSRRSARSASGRSAASSGSRECSARWFGAARVRRRPQPAIERNWIKLLPELPRDALADRGGAARSKRSGTICDRHPVAVHVHPRRAPGGALDRCRRPARGQVLDPVLRRARARPRRRTARRHSRIDPRVRDLGTARQRASSTTRCPSSELCWRATVASRCGSDPAGSPMRPISPSELAGKVRDLAGDRLVGVLDDLGAPRPAR